MAQKKIIYFGDISGDLDTELDEEEDEESFDDIDEDLSFFLSIEIGFVPTNESISFILALTLSSSKLLIVSIWISCFSGALTFTAFRCFLMGEVFFGPHFSSGLFE